jgi:hypothetical protein
MTSSGATPTGPQSENDLRNELDLVEEERADLLRQAKELRASLGDDAGPMDAEEATAIITQAEELEAFAAVLERRREALLEKLGESP